MEEMHRAGRRSPETSIPSWAHHPPSTWMCSIQPKPLQALFFRVFMEIGDFIT